ncbi:hypothetical protein OG906_25025 [Streptomyces sp. NBC_01426]|nr:hypothetical protein [Streptomyces sp. NBC_01426]
MSAVEESGATSSPCRHRPRGSGGIRRDTIAERILGLPKEVRA